MKKVAIFTEGQTEQIFVERLITEIAGRKKLQVETRRAFGGSNKLARTTLLVKGDAQRPEAEYFALIWDCGSEGRVTSDVRDQYNNLVSSGYTVIIAIRDVRPNFSLIDIPRLKAGFLSSISHSSIVPQLVLAAMEIEAWFLGESTHLLRIDPTLTLERIEFGTGLNLKNVNVETIANPTQFISTIYSWIGMDYSKSRKEVDRIVQALDFDMISKNLSDRAANFRPLLNSMQMFFR